MRSLLCILCLTTLLFTISDAATFAADDEAPKKGKFDEKSKEKLFAKIDENNDGKISKEEFEKFFEKIAKGKLQGKGGQISKRLFDRLDTNKDGFLSKEEFAKIGENAGKFGKKKDDE